MARVGILQTRNGCATFSSSAPRTQLSRVANLGQTMVINRWTDRAGNRFEDVYRTDGETRPGDGPISPAQVREWAARALEPGCETATAVGSAPAVTPPPAASLSAGENEVDQIPAVTMTRGKRPPTMGGQTFLGRSAVVSSKAAQAADMGSAQFFGPLGGLVKTGLRKAGGLAGGIIKDLIPGSIDDKIIDTVGGRLFGGTGCTSCGSNDTGAPILGQPGGGFALPGQGGLPGRANPKTGRTAPAGEPRGMIDCGTPATGWNRVEGRYGVGLRPICRQDKTGRVYRDCPQTDVLGKDGVCYSPSQIKNAERLNPKPVKRRRKTRRHSHSHSHSHSHRKRRRSSSKKCWTRRNGKCYSKAQAKAGFAGPAAQKRARR